MKMSRLATTAALVVSLSGCAIGFNSPTQVQRPVTDGVNLNADGIQVRNVLLVVDPAKPQTAAVVATLVNTSEQDDTLTAITGGGGLTGARFAPLTLPAGQSVQVGYNTDAVLALTSDAPIQVSTYVTVTLVFANAASVELSLQVYPNTGHFADVTIPTVTDGALPGAEPSASPMATESPEPSPSPTAS